VGRTSGAGRFATTFLSLGGEEYRVGDTFDLRVVDPSGTFGGLRETRRVITREEMRNGRIDLGAVLLSAVPDRSALLPNFPNPFNPETWIPFQLSTESAVKVSIYNAGAERIRSLDLGYLPAGTYASRTKAAYWDGSNEMGERVSSGVYFYRIEAGSFSEMRRMVILK
ncbi:MAG: FlgD immunoglobulin-like domain containing protein, partial [Candidatus Poribacteria bacterium]